MRLGLSARQRQRDASGRGTPAMAEIRKATLFTNEYPPHVYGGAGVHVEYLSRALARRIAVEVRCFGEQRSDDAEPRRPRLPALGRGQGRTPTRALPARSMPSTARWRWPRTRSMPTSSTATPGTPTWAACSRAGCGTSRSCSASIRSSRSGPWKVEQLGNGYHLSSWMERTAIEHADAIVAVSQQTREDVLRLFDVQPARVHVIHNGIDPDEYRPTGATDALARHGIDPATPYVLFVGRITRQKGIIHLVDAIPEIDPGLQIVLCAGAPDTPEIGREMAARVAEVSARRAGRDLDPRDAAAGRGDPALRARGGVLLPLGLRAVRHHQSRGDGLRDRGGRLARSAASRRWWCPRRPACWSI